MKSFESMILSLQNWLKMIAVKIPTDSKKEKQTKNRQQIKRLHKQIRWISVEEIIIIEWPMKNG